MAGLFDRAGINRGVTTGSQQELFGDQTVQVIAAAILDINGTPTLANDVTAEEITDLLGVEIADITDNGDDTYLVTRTDGMTFTIDATAHSLTGDEVIALINAAAGSTLIEAAHTEATVTVANPSTTPASALDTIEISGTSYRVGGSTPAHARLRTSLTLSQNSVQLPILGTGPITGTVSATIDNPVAGDDINNVTIHSVHSSYADDRTGSPVVVNDETSTFAWNYQAGDSARVVTFTVSYTVSGVIDGELNVSHHTDTIDFTIIAEPQHFWTGTVTLPQLNTLTTTLADNELNNIPAITRRDNFVSPFTLEYNGGTTPSVYPVIIVDQSIAITSLRVEGIGVTLSSFNDSTTGRTIYTTEGFLSEGPHNLTWRTG